MAVRKKKFEQALRGKKYVFAKGRGDARRCVLKLQTCLWLHIYSVTPPARPSSLSCSWRHAQKANSISAHTRAFCTSGPFVNAKSARCKYRSHPSIGWASPPRGDVEHREGRTRLLTLNRPGWGKKITRVYV